MESHGNYFGQHQKCPDLRLRNLKLNSRTSPERDSWNLCSNIILRSWALTNCSLLSNCQNADQSISIQLPSSLHQAFENSKAFLFNVLRVIFTPSLQKPLRLNLSHLYLSINFFKSSIVRLSTFSSKTPFSFHSSIIKFT